ncbi:MAG: carbon-nitrogen hydrolase family protein [Rhodospirillaceae bacterium]|jgi:deaminated glutathione amidase|nr:carbon-nitrogen hydrolase family protein [Rhodospirillaceae bacterium]MBT4487777.1 carbon-nitrogen hydrolase family protein [Rhodospirillaceae bacterium]MBT5192856.1 carbon-nitrogen hydrolase family protein [Rhodospirillaceae bacterium]MBT5897340.1 carbon-nitrogen hydrolase family protein [Rhodospirillaceae bacterium]MBT7757638.1 carbon-nitrogen hydrolase family protein [Rhodospirillaceae bacterium]
MTSFQAACVQINASNDLDQNIASLGRMIREARAAGADFITTPECAAMIEVGRDNIRGKAFVEAEHPALAAFREWAVETGAWLLAGSLSVLLEGEERLANRQYLIDPTGAIAARYDKIHMFDVDLPNGKRLRESNNYRPGADAVVTPLPWCQLGLSICYDLRFPHLYRDLAKAGADVLVIPSAFMQVTGEAHWHVLMRARAIETGCFVIAAAQCGEHVAGRLSYGHSVIIAPWGEVLTDGGTDEGISLAEIDLTAVGKARGHIPALEHDRDYQLIAPAADVSTAAE